MKQVVSYISLFAILCLVGCSTKSNIIGKWILTSVEKDGVKITGEELHTLYGGEILYHFEKDNILSVEMVGQMEKGTWEEQENQVIIRYYDQEMSLEVEGNKMKLEQNGTHFILEKQKD